MKHFKMTYTYFMNGQFVGSWRLTPPSVTPRTLWTVASIWVILLKRYINSVESQKDLGILFDHQLKFHLHTTDVADRLLGLIRRSFDPDLATCWLNYLLLWSVLHWSTAIRYGGHYLLLIKGKSKRFSV